ncbi:hypothetical protein NQZ79_g4239 [Umbelopsis isabellina]|nr:hypothetical protein NQZ79_g4239 [Umbelopsis isabellina]
MQSAECQKPRKNRQSSIEDLPNPPHDSLQRNDEESVLFQEFHLEPLDYNDIFGQNITQQRRMETNSLHCPEHTGLSQDILDTCSALDLSCLYLLDAFVLRYSTLTVDHDLRNCHKMLSELISRHSKSRMHNEILDSIQVQLKSVIKSKDTQALIDHLVTVAINIQHVLRQADTAISRQKSCQFTNEDTDEAMMVVKQITEDLKSLRMKDSTLSGDVWSKIDTSLNAIDNLIDNILSDSQLPLYDEACEATNQDDKLPSYYTNSANLDDKSSSDRELYDLDGLFSALDRITISVPRFHDQCFEMNDEQQGVLDASTITATLDRLNRGRLNDQRADIPQQDELNQAAHNTKRTSVDYQKQRNAQQKYPEQVFLSMMRRWIQHVLNYGERRRDRSRQKTKAERDRYTLDLIARFDRLREKTRFHNQDAVMMLCYRELDQILSHLDRSKSQFSNQRATFRTAPTTAS